MQVTVGGLTFDVLAGGPEHGRPVLLLHGFPENARMWDGVTPALHAAGLRTYALDQRGYSPGARPRDVAAYASSELVGDVLGVLDALGVSTVDVVGHDWGAAVAWELAARHPDRVRTLTVVSVPHPAAYGWALRSDARQRELSQYVGLFQQPGKAERVLLADDGRRLAAILDPLPAETVEACLGPMREPGALTAALNWYRAVGEGDQRPVGKVQVPTTYLWGTEDLAVSRAAAERCAEHVAGEYEFVELPGVSHWVPQLEPETVARLVVARIAGERPDT